MGADAETTIIDALCPGACDEQGLLKAVERMPAAFDVPFLLLGDLDPERLENNSRVGAGMMDAASIQLYMSPGQHDPAAPVLAHLTPGTAGLTYRLIDDAVLLRGEVYDSFV